MQNIQKTAIGCFRTFWTEQPDDILNLDFNVFHPWVQGDYYCLLHWQAKPKGRRRWGIYCKASDNYYGADWCRLEIHGFTQLIPLQVDENIVPTVPTAVLYLPNVAVSILPSGLTQLVKV